VAMSQSLVHWLRVLRQAPALGGGRWRRLPGVLLAWRDAAPFVRLHFLAVATDLGLLEELRRGPATANQLGVRLAIGNPALLDAFLRLGAALGELRCRAGRWSLRGRRSNALAQPEADTMRAMVQEALRYDAAVYAGLPAASFDLVLLLQNIYYFAEDERPGLLRRLHGLLAPGGALLPASLFAGSSLAAAHYDLLFRATAGCAPLPRRQQLDRQLHHVGFTATRWARLMPLESFHAVVAQR
jgi:hypothetical protein